MFRIIITDEIYVETSTESVHSPILVSGPDTTNLLGAGKFYLCTLAGLE